MLVTELKSNVSTIKYDMDGYTCWVYENEVHSDMFKWELGITYYIVVESTDGKDLTKYIANKLRYCYSNFGYIVVNTIKLDWIIENIVRCLYYGE